MQIVIDIPEEVYNSIQDNDYCGISNSDMYNAIVNGTPLPKGHGRLKDIDKVERFLDLEKPDNTIAKALKNIMESVPTIIEADPEKE